MFLFSLFFFFFFRIKLIDETLPRGEFDIKIDRIDEDDISYAGGRKDWPIKYRTTTMTQFRKINRLMWTEESPTSPPLPD